MRRAPAWLAFLFLLAATPGPLSARDDDGLRLRMFDVGALVQGVPWFYPPVVGTVRSDAVNDEGHPLFGAEGEEPILPFGTVDELIELVKAGVEPTYWVETEGADLRAMGMRLVVQARLPVLESVARYLSGLEAAALASVTVEVVAVRGSAGDAGRSLDDLVARAQGPRLVLTALDRQRAVGFAGRQAAYVQDYDTEVAQDAKVADPIVNVANLGLGVAVQAVLGGLADGVLLQLDATAADLTALREHAAAGDQTIELPACALTRVRTDRVLPVGRWARVEGAAGGDGAGWSFLVRATPLRPAPSVAAAPVVFGPRRTAASAPMSMHRFDVGDLAASPPSRRGERIHLWPSNYTPPEPPELLEPQPFFPPEAAVELLRVVVGGWDEDGASAEVRNGWLLVRHSDETARSVAGALRALRGEVLTTVETTAEVVRVPEAAARGLGDAAREGYLLDEGERALVLGWEGARVERHVVVNGSGALAGTTSGRRIAYLADYDVEVAEAATIANPIAREIFSGTVLDLEAGLTSARDAVNLCVRFCASAVEEPLRQVRTPHGSLDVPRMALTELRTNLRVPLGRTAVVGAGTDGGWTTILLLTPRLLSPP